MKRHTLAVWFVLFGSILIGHADAPLSKAHQDRSEAAGNARVSEQCSLMDEQRKTRGEVEQTARGLIGKIFRERKGAEAFERYFQFAPAPEEIAALKEMGYDPIEDLSKYRDTKLAARVLAVGWYYEYQPALLTLATTPLSSAERFKENLERAQAEIEKERRVVLNKRGVSDEAAESRCLDTSWFRRAYRQSPTRTNGAQ
ncbi:MAG TPA: hypothetical protein DCK99_15545 [Blastocatellia bacterium]|nr:hypothetical protein [Blastocatellia bacterium]